MLGVKRASLDLGESMGTILRIRSQRENAIAGDAPIGGGGTSPDTAKQYVERVVKLIPSEVVGAYLVGKAGIQAKFADKADHSQDLISESTYWIGWAVFCFLAVILIRAWATSDRNTPVEKPAVVIAAVSFLIWVYSLGDAFKFISVRDHSVWDSLLAMLLVFAWTLLVPLIYREKKS
jgi:hypothetical protein